MAQEEYVLVIRIGKHEFHCYSLYIFEDAKMFGETPDLSEVFNFYYVKRLSMNEDAALIPPRKLF